MTPIESAEAFADGAMAADNLESPAVLAKRLWAQLESAHELADAIAARDALAESWRDAAWTLAMWQALGFDSGHKVPEAEFLSGALADEVSRG